MPPFVLNIPNAITLLRFVLIPMASIPLLPYFGTHNEFVLNLVFVSFMLAGFTDYLDGYLARKLNQITEWGAYVDPLIDKFLIWALYCVFIFIKELHIPIWTFIIIFARDIIVTEMRNYAIKHNITFKTSSLAKLKTASQMFVGLLVISFLVITFYLNKNSSTPMTSYLAYWQGTFMYYVPMLMVSVVAIFTAITGIDYAWTLYKEINKK